MEALDVVMTAAPCDGFSKTRRHRSFDRPRLDLWSINIVGDVECLSGQGRADYERELRITMLGNLLCAWTATPLWRRVCHTEMMREIKARSEGQRVAMDLVLAESSRGQL